MKQDLRIERYVLNQMTDTEASEFEAYFLSNQECIEQLELTEKLYEGLKILDHKAIGNQSDIAVGEQKKWWHKEFPAWSMAAMLALTLLPTTLMLVDSNNPNNNAVQVVSFELSSSRSREEDVIIASITEKQLILATYIDREVQDLSFPQYGFSVARSSDEKIVAANQALKISSDDMLYLNLGALPANKYTLQIIGINESSKPVVLKQSILKLTN